MTANILPALPGSMPWLTGRKIGLLLLFMLTVDVIFMGTTLLNDWGYIQDKRWSAEEDRGFGELFMYVQELGLIALCLMLWNRTRQAFALVWAGAFLFLFIDDAFRMHETFGHVFDDWTQIERRGMMRAQDYGEFLAWVPFIILIAGLVLWSHIRSDRRHRPFLYGLYVLGATLVGLGVGLDILSRYYNFWGHTNIVSMLEDGGEMVIVSLMLALLMVKLMWTGDSKNAPSRSIARTTADGATENAG